MAWNTLNIPRNETADHIAKQAARFHWTGACIVYTFNNSSYYNPAMCQCTTVKTLANHYWLSAGINVPTWTR